MPREKPIQRNIGQRDVVYSPDHWQQLSELRTRANEIMNILEQKGVESIIHGSICRGDITDQSDIDIYVPRVVSTFTVELLLGEAGFQIIHRELVQATPFHAIKAHIFLPNNSVVTIPLTNPAPIELEFYKFGGSLERNQLEKNQRVPGVDKQLLLIEPTDNGHCESPVKGNEIIVAKKVGVSLKIVQERVKILVRRDQVGRTGVYLKRTLMPDDTFESLLKRIADRDPVVRRRLQKG
jgi:predicted nucleotidyltransferase